LFVVLYGYRTWSLTTREEYKLRVSENRVLRKVLGLERNEIAGDWKRLHDEKLCDTTSPNIIGVI
jgi:hypothetical protein